ncbi:hypothetical protein MTO96_032877 [Rhipicephalus appendiculatus]
MVSKVPGSKDHSLLQLLRRGSPLLVPPTLPKPYNFGYDTTDEFGTQLFHKEQGDASNAKTGCLRIPGCQRYIPHSEAPFLLAFVTFVRAGNVFGGGQRYGFQGAGFQGPLFAAAATPGFSAAGAAYPPQPYSFGYDTTDEFGTQLFHKEQGDASNAKTGAYGYRDANGIFRTVKYVA